MEVFTWLTVGLNKDTKEMTEPSFHLLVKLDKETETPFTTIKEQELIKNDDYIGEIKIDPYIYRISCYNDKSKFIEEAMILFSQYLENMLEKFDKLYVRKS